MDVSAVNTRLYEEMPQAKLELLGLALARIQRFDEGTLTLVALDAQDFHALIERLPALAAHVKETAERRLADRTWAAGGDVAADEIQQAEPAEGDGGHRD